LQELKSDGGLPNYMVIEQMARARRVTEVHATGDFSFRNKQFTDDRWVLAGDAPPALLIQSGVVVFS